MRCAFPSYRSILAQVTAAPDPDAYTDTAVTPLEQGEEEALDLSTATAAGRGTSGTRAKSGESVP